MFADFGIVLDVIPNRRRQMDPPGELKPVAPAAEAQPNRVASAAREPTSVAALGEPKRMARAAGAPQPNIVSSAAQEPTSVAALGEPKCMARAAGVQPNLVSSVAGERRRGASTESEQLAFHPAQKSRVETVDLTVDVEGEINVEATKTKPQYSVFDKETEIAKLKGRLLNLEAEVASKRQQSQNTPEQVHNNCYVHNVTTNVVHNHFYPPAFVAAHQTLPERSALTWRADGKTTQKRKRRAGSKKRV
jgi:hypothetical protein